MDGLFIMENLIKMDDLGVPLFLETPIWVVLFFLWWFLKTLYFHSKPRGNNPFWLILFKLSWSHHLVLYVKEASLNQVPPVLFAFCLSCGGGGWALQYIQDKFHLTHTKDCTEPDEMNRQSTVSWFKAVTMSSWDVGTCGLEPRICAKEDLSMDVMSAKCLAEKFIHMTALALTSFDPRANLLEAEKKELEAEGTSEFVKPRNDKASDMKITCRHIAKFK